MESKEGAGLLGDEMLVLEACHGSAKVAVGEPQSAAGALNGQGHSVHVGGGRECEHLDLRIGAVPHQPTDLRREDVTEPFTAGQVVGELERQAVRLVVRLTPVRLGRQARLDEVAMDAFSDLLIEAHIDPGTLRECDALKCVFDACRADHIDIRHRRDSADELVPARNVGQADAVDKEADWRRLDWAPSFSQPAEVVDVGECEAMNPEPRDAAGRASAHPHHGRLADP
ncbi:MAG: hypothetical protein IPO93_16090 [Actinobacteria bacterium]|nr:hypothetical protein [Actinomycetota bacterium]